MFKVSYTETFCTADPAFVHCCVSDILIKASSFFKVRDVDYSHVCGLQKQPCQSGVAGVSQKQETAVFFMETQSLIF